MGRVRLMHFYAVDGGPGPTLDVYPSPEVVFTTLPEGTTPLLTNLAWGQVSDYVSPPARPNNSGVLSFFLAGKRDKASCVFGCTPPGSFKEGDQASIFLAATQGTAGFFTIYEAGPTGSVPTPAAGKALVFGNGTPVDSMHDQLGTIDFGVGAGCLTQQSNQTANIGYVYEVAPGTLQVSAWLTPPGSTTAQTCTGAPAAGPVTVDARAGSRTHVFVIGTSPTSLTLIAVPVP